MRASHFGPFLALSRCEIESREALQEPMYINTYAYIMCYEYLHMRAYVHAAIHKPICASLLEYLHMRVSS